MDDVAPVLDSANITGNSVDGYTVSGEGEEPGDTVFVYDSDDTQVGSAVIDENGFYNVSVAAGTVDIGEALSVVAIDDAGNESDPLALVVPDDDDTDADADGDVDVEINAVNGELIEIDS